MTTSPVERATGADEHGVPCLDACRRHRTLVAKRDRRTVIVVAPPVEAAVLTPEAARAFARSLDALATAAEARA